MESYCLPILLYASESLYLPYSQLADINAWCNSVYRKFFNYNKWESVKLLICLLGRIDLFHIYNLRSMNFILRLAKNEFLHYDYKVFVDLFINSKEYMFSKI